MRTTFVGLIAAASIVATARAGTRIEPLRPLRGAPAVSCTADRAWCAAVTGSTATVRYRDADVAKLPLESNEEERVESALWPSIVRVTLPGQPEFVLVGVARTQREAYSGGGGSVTTLTLFELRADAKGRPRAVLEAPLQSSFLIRACFARADERQRRGVCHDEYRYRAALTAPPGGKGGIRLVYTARADSFPGRRSRFEESTLEGPLRKADLYRAVDRRCTFKRELVRDAGTGRFEWVAPLPGCPDYLDLQ